MSFGLPHSTEVNKPLPKKAIFAKFGLKAALRDHFDGDISRLVISHEITTRSVPALVTVDIQAIYVVSVLLKRRDFDHRNIELLTKLIPQKMVLALQYGEETMLAIHQIYLMFSDWRQTDEINLPLNGLSLDDVWQALVMSIGNIAVSDGKSLDEQIIVDERLARLQKQIAALENKMRKEKQPRKKYELYQQIQKTQEISWNFVNFLQKLKNFWLFS